MFSVTCKLPKSANVRHERLLLHMQAKISLDPESHADITFDVAPPTSKRTSFFLHLATGSPPSITMDRRVRDLQLPDTAPSASTTLVYSVLAILAIHQLLLYLDYPVLSPQDLLWNALVYVTPTRLLLDAGKRQELRANHMLSQTHAAKGEALRRMLGLGTSTLTHKLSGGEGLMRRMSVFAPKDASVTDAPPGLGNWDNSCYQNSVLQGLASLGSLKSHLESSKTSGEGSISTTASLRETVVKLSEANNNGKQLWTPAKLKSMSSWQQQDAQEYFSKIMDELDKEASKAASMMHAKSGLEAAAEQEDPKIRPSVVDGIQEDSVTTLQRNPMEGLLAQRVACTKCGFSEGLSMIPFNCLTVPLGPNNAYDLSECLDEYTKLEEINDVDCAKCTLLRAEGQLRQMLPTTKQATLHDEERVAESSKKQQLMLPPELRVLAAKRLQTIQKALDEDDFSDKSLNEICQIPKKAHVSSTKTRQAVIGRPPQSLVVHVNRSVFDELTGVQRKNYASVRYPTLLDLSAWTLGEHCGETATQSMLHESGETECLYRLKAVVTHYGRHENGHYICYRQHPVRPAQERHSETDEGPEAPRERWWRLSDEDVSSVTEENVLARGDAFMLFYEREDVLPKPAPAIHPTAAVMAGETAANHVSDTMPQKAATAPPPMDEADDDLRSTQPEASPTSCPRATSPPVEPAAGKPSTDGATRDETPAADEAESTPVAAPTQKPPTPPHMRTSRSRETIKRSSRSEGGFANAFRPMAAT